MQFKSGKLRMRKFENAQQQGLSVLKSVFVEALEQPLKLCLQRALDNLEKSKASNSKFSGIR